MKHAAPAVALVVALTAAPARSAPMGSGVEPATVLAFEVDVRAGPELDLAAKSLTNALRQAVLDSPEYTLGGQSPALFLVARDAGCRLNVAPGRAIDERTFDEACLRKVGKRLETRRFFWGFLAVEGGQPVARLHLWQQGEPDRVASLPHDPPARDRIAERLYRKLVTPDRVGDVAVSGTFEGELVVDEKAAGSYANGAELTLPDGEHTFEVRQGPRVVARAKVRVAPRGRVDAVLAPVVEPAPSPHVPPFTEPPAVVVRPRASAWPWVLGGTAAAGLAGAGVFWALRTSERADLERVCYGRDCPPTRESTGDRVNLYRTLSAVSLGVGVVAGAGLAAYLLTPGKRPPPVSGAIVPIVGGAAAGVAGSF